MLQTSIGSRAVRRCSLVASSHAVASRGAFGLRDAVWWFHALTERHRSASSCTSSSHECSHHSVTTVKASVPNVACFDVSTLPSALQREFDAIGTVNLLRHLSSVARPDPSGAPIPVTPSSRWVVAWVCAECSESFSARVCDRVHHGELIANRCPKCSVAPHDTAHSNRRLVNLYPEIAKDWDTLRNEVSPLSPLPHLDEVDVDSDANCWWNCRDCQKPWQEAVFSRVDRWKSKLRDEEQRVGGTAMQQRPPMMSRCPYCEELRTPMAERLARRVLSDHPLLMLEARLRPEHPAPTTMRLSDSHLVHWRCCACSHEYTATVSDRALRGTRCPVCTGSKSSPLNQLAAQRPDVMRELAAGLPERLVEQLTTSSPRRATFVCRTCMEAYAMTVQQRCLTPPGVTACPKCRMVALQCITERRHDTKERRVLLPSRYRRRSKATMAKAQWRLDQRFREPALLN